MQRLLRPGTQMRAGAGRNRAIHRVTAITDIVLAEASTACTG
jgi:hypothetical protein